VKARPPFLFTAFLFQLALGLAASAQQVRYDHGDPTEFEQLMLELVNTARAYPAVEAARLRINLNKGLAPGQISSEAKQPLAFHPILLEAARRHSDWMLQQDIFSHDGANNSTPTERAAALGFAFGVWENIARQATSANPSFRLMTQNNHNSLFRSPSHRVSLMNPQLSVVGLGVRRGLWKRLNSQMVTQNFAARGESDDLGHFLVGVAYADLNNNGAYDPGEGRAGIEVRPESGAYYAVTSSSGGFAIPITATRTTNEEVLLPIELQGKDFNDVRNYDAEFRATRFAAAREVQTTLRWSGGSLPAPLETTVQAKEAERINYKLKGTDGYWFSNTMVTGRSVRANLRLAANGQLAPRLPQTLTFAAPRPVTYSPGRVVPLKGSASSRLPVTFVSTNALAEISGSAVLVHGAGEFEIVARQTGDDVYQPVEQKQILKVAKGKQVTTFLLPRKVPLAAGTLTFEAFNKSGLPVTFTSNLPNIVSINGSTATLHAAGTVEITATQDGNDNYLPAKTVKRLLTVTP
jgi:uncharacterized protein YkwD